MLVEDNVDFMIQNKGVEWLLAALQSALGDHSGVSQRILDQGCRAIGRMCLSEKKIYSMMQKGGVKLLTAIVNEHVKEKKVVTSALTGLAKLVTRYVLPYHITYTYPTLSYLILHYPTLSFPWQEGERHLHREER